MFRKPLLHNSSARVSLEVFTPFDNPDVGLTVYYSDSETPVPVNTGASFSEWPLALERVGGQDRWETTLNCEDISVRVGQSLELAVSFDDGPANCRVFWQSVSVQRG